MGALPLSGVDSRSEVLCLTGVRARSESGTSLMFSPEPWIGLFRILLIRCSSSSPGKSGSSPELRTFPFPELCRNWWAERLLLADWVPQPAADSARVSLRRPPRRGCRLVIRVDPDKAPAGVFHSAELPSGFPPGDPSSSVSISRGWGGSIWRKTDLRIPSSGRKGAPC